MATDELDGFARVARDFCTLMTHAAEISLQQRVFGLYTALTRVLSAGASLPVMPGDPSGAAPPDEPFPGMGSYEAYWTVGALHEPGEPLPMQMSMTLMLIHGSLSAGLRRLDEGDREGAAGAWGLGFENTWGKAASELVHALHPVVAAYRGDLRQDTRGSRLPAPVLVQSAEPVGESVGLGVEFSAVPGGLEVTSVHPRGPAAGQLEPGDLIITINGDSLQDVPDELEPPLRFELFRNGETVYAVVNA